MGTLLDKFRSAKAAASMAEPVADDAVCQSRQDIDAGEPIIPGAVADTADETLPVSAGDAIATPDDVPVEETENPVSGDSGAIEAADESLGRFYVYELRDQNGNVFYVGKGSGYRMRSHLAKALRGERTHKAQKIRSLIANGGEVIPVAVYRTHDESEAYRVETELIARYGRGNLTNHTDGGCGSRNLSPEAKEKIAKSRRGVIASAETRERQRQAKLGKPRSKKTRAKISAYQKGSKHPWASERARANLAKGMGFAGRKHSPETIAKIRATKLGHTVSEETRRKISATKRAKRLKASGTDVNSAIVVIGG